RLPQACHVRGKVTAMFDPIEETSRPTCERDRRAPKQIGPLRFRLDGFARAVPVRSCSDPEPPHPRSASDIAPAFISGRVPTPAATLMWNGRRKLQAVEWPEFYRLRSSYGVGR